MLSFKIFIMRILSVLALFLITTSCIPTRIAPSIKTNKIMQAKKFKKGLPKQDAFIFEDPKDANHFYTYINTKYQLNHNNVDNNVPIQINNTTYYLSFYETQIDDKTLNFVPILVDAKLSQNGDEPILQDMYESRKGNYYIVLTVYDAGLKNCLSENYNNNDIIINHLEEIRIEYLNTYNYEELLFKKKS